ncbi:hypothetical protein [Paraburkholderia tropica]|uniref:hypothetical protein n=1 Tax=Paraburkholderia tropica TaxID=92647 RepID=UPI002AAF1E1A|nr:hypothetical protein [Paraburkholderia tropica]
MAKIKEISVSFIKFKITLESEIRLFWHVLSAIEYSNRYLEAVSPQPSVLSKNQGDDRNPFKSVNLSPTAFIDNSDFVRRCMRENSIVSIVTTFERFLFDQLERIIYISPDKLSDSEVEFMAKELVSIPKEMTLNRWLAARVSDKQLRNNTHKEMIAKIGRFASFSLGRKNGKTTESLSKPEALLEEWHKWTLVRNSIVHTARSVTSDLSVGWPERFPSAGAALSLTDEDVVAVHKTALFLAEYIDGFVTKNIIKEKDAVLLAQELFMHKGISDPRKIREFLSHTLHVPRTIQQIEGIISKQRKDLADNGWSVSFAELVALIKYSEVPGLG